MCVILCIFYASDPPTSVKIVFKFQAIAKYCAEIENTDKRLEMAMKNNCYKVAIDVSWVWTVENGVTYLQTLFFHAEVTSNRKKALKYVQSRIVFANVSLQGAEHF